MLGLGFGKILALGGYAIMAEGGMGVALRLDVRMATKVTMARAKSDVLKIYVNSELYKKRVFNVTKSGEVSAEVFALCGKYVGSVLALFINEHREQLEDISLLDIDINADGRFYRGDGKSGLGSSAAVVSSLCRSLCECIGVSDPEEQMDLASRAHSEAQGHVGSNYDIITNFVGSCLLTKHHGELESTPFGFPPNTHIALLDVSKKFGFTGSETTSMVRQFDALPEPLKEQHFNCVQRCVTLLVEYFRHAAMLEPFKREVAHLRSVFHEISDKHSVPLEPREIRPLLDRLNADADVILALVPGAGGYDSPFVLFHSTESISRILERCGFGDIESELLGLL